MFVHQKVQIAVDKWTLCCTIIALLQQKVQDTTPKWPI